MSERNTVLDEVTRRVVRDYLNVQPDERFVLITDDGAALEVSEALVRAARDLGNDVVHAAVPTRPTSGAEPPSALRAAMVEADVCLCITERSIFHTNATEAAMESGTRGVFNAPVSLGAWTEGAMTADFTKIRETNLALAGRLDGAEVARVTTPAGTDIMVGIHGRKPRGWLTGITHNPGEVSAFPGGEVSFPPMEGTSQGCIVIERVMTDLGGICEPIEWIVKDGNVVEINGGKDAERLRRLIDGVPFATNLAELGIGTNPQARVSDDITESKKRLSTAHMAIGDSAAGYGGTTVCDLHLDGLMFDVSITVDDRQLSKDGELLI